MKKLVLILSLCLIAFTSCIRKEWNCGSKIAITRTNNEVDTISWNGTYLSHNGFHYEVKVNSDYTLFRIVPNQNQNILDNMYSILILPNGKIEIIDFYCVKK